jgi:hypothetical protein
MLDLLIRGGLTFTLPLTAIAIAVIIAAARAALGPVTGQGNTFFWKRTVFHLGLFALVFGFLSHAISLYQMMRSIEAVGGPVSPAMVMGGLRLSFIAPIYGLGIFTGALLLWLLLNIWLRNEIDASRSAKTTVDRASTLDAEGG